MTVQVHGLYQLEDGTVVGVLGRTRERYRLARFADGRAFGVRREGFEQQVREGYIQRVRPTGWQVVGEREAENGASASEA